MARETIAVVGHVSAMGPEAEMPSALALATLAALGQPTRLEIFKLLMRSQPDGLAAGSIAEHLGVPQNTASAHVAILARSGLVAGTRDGRSIIYRANVERMRTLIEYLIDDCCDRHPELCGFTAGNSEDKACGCKPGDKSAKRGSNP